jgi:hypothetical protein
MRIIALALLALSASPSFADGRLAPEAFVGNYKLVTAKIGLLCDENMQGLLSKSLNKHDDSYVQIDLGAFPFPGVNLGAQTYEDDMATSVSESYTTADSIVFTSREVSKIDGEVSTEKTVATLNGKTLHLVSHGEFAHPGGSKGDTDFECVYTKVDSSK